jgi:hypothetical protein
VFPRSLGKYRCPVNFSWDLGVDSSAVNETFAFVSLFDHSGYCFSTTSTAYIP